MSQTQSHFSNISCICQEIHDIKDRKKPKSNLSNQNYTQGPDSNSSAKEGSGDEDGWGDTYSSHSKLCHHEPKNPDTC